MVWVVVVEHRRRRDGSVYGMRVQWVVARLLGGEGRCAGHEQHQKRTDMFAFALRIVLCDGIQNGVSRSKQLSDVLVEKLEFPAYDFQRVYCNVTALRSSRQDIGDGVLYFCDCSGPC